MCIIFTRPTPYPLIRFHLINLHSEDYGYAQISSHDYYLIYTDNVVETEFPIFINPDNYRAEVWTRVKFPRRGDQRTGRSRYFSFPGVAVLKPINRIIIENQGAEEITRSFAADREITRYRRSHDINRCTKHSPANLRLVSFKKFLFSLQLFNF